MAGISSQSRLFRFAVFELDTANGELRKEGRKVAIHEQPLQILTLLVEHAGQLVTREQLRQRLWPDDTFVDFDRSLNTAVSKLRDALGDSAAAPRFIQTVPRRGYRFLADVDAAKKGTPEQPTVQPRRWPPWIAGGVMAILVATAGISYWTPGRRPPAAPRNASVAVLPFLSAGGGLEEEYLSDGFTDELINALGRTKGLHVVARTSSFHLKGKKLDAREVGKLLGVDAFVEGTMRAVPGGLRITTQLIKTANGFQMWAHTFEPQLKDLPQAQQSIAKAVVQHLLPGAEVAHNEPSHGSYSKNAEAQMFYLRAKYFRSRWSMDAVLKSVEYYQQAIALDPQFAAAFAGLADAYLSLAILNYEPRPAVMPKARQAVLKAMELDANLGQAHSVLASILFTYDWDWAGAEKEYQRAIELSPGDSGVAEWYGTFLWQQGRFAESLVEARRAERFDSLSPSTVGMLAGNYFEQGDTKGAFEQLNKAIDLDPTFYFAYAWRAQLNTQMGQLKMALADLQRAVTLSQRDPALIAALGAIEARLGNRPEAKNLLREATRDGPRPAPAYEIATLLANLDRRDEAFEWLERGYREKQGNMLWLGIAEIYAELAPLRTDARFGSLVRRMNLESVASRVAAASSIRHAP